MNTSHPRLPAQVDPVELEMFGDVVRRLADGLGDPDSGPQRVLTTAGGQIPELGAFPEAGELERHYLTALTDFADGLHSLERLLTDLYTDCERLSGEPCPADDTPQPVDHQGAPARRTAPREEEAA